MNRLTINETLETNLDLPDELPELIAVLGGYLNQYSKYPKLYLNRDYYGLMVNGLKL